MRIYVVSGELQTRLPKGRRKINTFHTTYNFSKPVTFLLKIIINEEILKLTKIFLKYTNNYSTMVQSIHQ